MKKQTSSEMIGFVSIGRNEGDRLKVGLNAIKSICPNAPIVYVDSGSNDDSVNFAKSIGASTVELDMSTPFTAARARNAGFKKLLDENPDLTFVQFFDGDCELQPGWIEAALDKLKSNELNGIVSGRRAERYPKASLYNKLIDIEWNTPVGETLAVLGDMCIRCEVFWKINGFDPTIIAAEDDDFCLRAKLAGYKVFRIENMMSHHDANMMKLSQWYKRAKRAGHGYANIFHLHGLGPYKYFQSAIKRVLFWGAIVPISFTAFLFINPTISVLILLFYLLFISKTILSRIKQGQSIASSIAYGFLLYTSKIAEFMGLIHYIQNYTLSRKHELIEYK